MEEKNTFEQSLERLEVIVRSLERGDAPLEETLNLFEEGAVLVERCPQQGLLEAMRYSLLSGG